MGRVLTGNVWINDVYYAAGTDEAGTGDAAGLIGDHLWREEAAAVPDPSAAIPVTEPEQSFQVEEQGPSQFAAAPDPPLEPSPVAEPDPAPVSEAEQVAEVTGDEVADGPVAEPVTVRAVPDIPIPPRGGKGSSTAHWVDYAKAKGVVVADGAERHQIIADLEAAGVPVSAE